MDIDCTSVYRMKTYNELKQQSMTGNKVFV